MAPELPPDFSEFLKLLNAHGVSYLIVGATRSASMGIRAPPQTSTSGYRDGPRRHIRSCRQIREFGFDTPELSPELFLRPDQVIRLGVPPVRIEILTSIAGVEFDQCAPRAVDAVLGGVPVRMIGLVDLKRNKRAAGRHQDLADLEHLP